VAGDEMSVNDLLTLALNLPEADRAKLAQELLLSLETAPFDADSENAWNAEIQARMAKVEKGEFTASDWREALGRMRQSLRKGPPA
jgi:putative addiction module component (TIGR02574 family)